MENISCVSCQIKLETEKLNNGCDICRKYICENCWKIKSTKIIIVEFYNYGTDYCEEACMNCVKRNFPNIKEVLQIYPNYGTTKL